MRYASNPNRLLSLPPHLHAFDLSLLAKTLNHYFPKTPPASLLHFQTLHSTPTQQLLYSLIISIGCPSFVYVSSPTAQSRHCCSFDYPSVRLGLQRPLGQFQFRMLSVSPSASNSKVKNIDVVDSVRQSGPNITPEQISAITEVIRSGEDDLDSKLNEMNISLAVESVNGIFHVLNGEKISALPFFEWALNKDPSLCRRADVYSLIIDNCGRLNDYETMLCLLKHFKSKGIRLNEKAFGFLSVLVSSKASFMEAIRKVIGVLKRAGGSCHSSGICGLLETLVKVDMFDLAKFVIETTEKKKTSYFHILILEKCRRCCYGEACDILEEMRKFDCYPDAKTYNFVLSALCKDDRAIEACNLLKEMEGKGCPPDALTFEIFIFHSVRSGRLDAAVEFLDQMTFRGLEPRITTHAALIKGLFNSNLYEEAYNYVVDAAAKYKHSVNAVYSLLANLHHKKGELLAAGNILNEMMDKGFIPDFSIYIKVSKRLYSTGSKQLARDLKIKFSELKSGLIVVTS